jgi:hypothetical protein
MEVRISNFSKSAYIRHTGDLVHTVVVSFYVGAHGPFFAEMKEHEYNLANQVRLIGAIKAAVEALCGRY